MARSSSWPRTPPSQGGDRGFESRTRYQDKQAPGNDPGAFICGFRGQRPSGSGTTFYFFPSRNSSIKRCSPSAELERQCQEIFDAGDVLISGALALMEDATLVAVGRWEPVKEPS